MTAAQGMHGQLAGLRLAAERVLVVVIWGHGLVLAAAGLVTGRGLALALLLWACIASTASIAHLQRPGAPATRITVAVALCVIPALLVYELAANPWQADAHMLFFAEIAAAAALLDRIAIGVGTTVIALHHLALNALMPLLVFPGAADPFRVAFHAAILAPQAIALILLVDRVATSIAAAESASVETSALADRTAAEKAQYQQRAAAERREATHIIAEELDKTLDGIAGGLAASAEHLDDRADVLAVAMSRSAEQARLCAENSEHASIGVETVAAAADEMTAIIGEITHRVGEAAGAVDNALSEARATDDTVRQLAESAARIGDVVQMIARIAKQTNLLALNATIEAARAGDHGKGFAVVANEVKLLASETAKATENIGAQIARMQGVTTSAVEAIRKIGTTIDQTSKISSAIAQAVEQQSAATREITDAARRAAEGTRAVSHAVTELSMALDSAQKSVQTVKGLSGDVATQTGTLKVRVTGFSQQLERQAAA